MKARIMIAVLMGTPPKEVMPKAKQLFREAGYLVELQDLYEDHTCEQSRVNPYDHFIATDSYIKLP